MHKDVAVRHDRPLIDALRLDSTPWNTYPLDGLVGIQKVCTVKRIYVYGKNEKVGPRRARAAPPARILSDLNFFRVRYHLRYPK